MDTCPIRINFSYFTAYEPSCQEAARPFLQVGQSEGRVEANFALFAHTLDQMPALRLAGEQVDGLAGAALGQVAQLELGHILPAVQPLQVEGVAGEVGVADVVDVAVDVGVAVMEGAVLGQGQAAGHPQAGEPGGGARPDRTHAGYRDAACEE